MKVLVPEEVAEVLRIDRKTVERLMRAGRIPGAKIGGRWRTLEAELDEFLRGGWKAYAPKKRKGAPPNDEAKTEGEGG